jgi:hypothetical protein
VAEPFAMENGLLTPTMKASIESLDYVFIILTRDIKIMFLMCSFDFQIKRPQAKEYFGKAISDMYNELSKSDPSAKPL